MPYAKQRTMVRWRDLLKIVLMIVVCLALLGWSIFAALQINLQMRRAEIELKTRAWVKCGKPWGKPCPCPPGHCRCGLDQFSQCENCRPMK
jgi:hypothetical protein